MLARTLVPHSLGTRQLAASGIRCGRFSHGVQQLQEPCSSAAVHWLAHGGHVPAAFTDAKAVTATSGTSPQAVAAVSAAVAKPQTVVPSSAAATALGKPANPIANPRHSTVLPGKRKHPLRPKTSQQRAPQHGTVRLPGIPQQQQQQQQWRWPAPAVQQQLPVAQPAQGNATVRGTVATITYTDNNGFIIAKLKDFEGTIHASAPADALKGGAAALAAAAKPAGRWKGSSSLLAVKGVMPGVKKSDKVEITGVWDNHTKHGWQVNVLHHKVLPPTNPEALLTRLRGVGPATAARIVEGLRGASVEEVLSSDNAVQQLSAIKGIGPATAAKVKQAWDADTASSALEQEASAWLLQHNIPHSIVKNLWKVYGATARDKATQDPYALITPSTGFKLHHAEVLAASIGFNPGAPERAAAVLHHELRAAASHNSACGMHWQQLEAKALKKLAELGQHSHRLWPRGVGLREGAELLVRGKHVVVEEVRPGSSSQQTAYQLTAAAQGASSQSLQQQQQQQHEFVRVYCDWSDGAFFMLSELCAAEQDVIDFYVNRSEACHLALARLQKQFGSSSNGSHISRSTSSSSSSTGSSSTLPYPLLPITLEVSAMIARCEKELSSELHTEVVLNEGQRHALMLAVAADLPAVVLTGGPGCGKTLSSQAVARLWMNGDEDLSMAAPTGRAAQRLQQLVTGDMYSATASTIHRLLGYRPYKLDAAVAGTAAASNDIEAEMTLGQQCTYGKRNKLKSSKLLIDEVSMMDVPLAAALYNAIDQHSALLLVGDPDQLPPVGPGRPLAAALAAGLLPCIDLRHIYRSAAGSAIVRAAHAINQGLLPSFTTWDINPATPAQDLAAHLAQVPLDLNTGSLQLPSNALFLRLPDRVQSQTVADTLLHTVQQLLPQLQCDPQLHVQVLSPTKKHACGTTALNARLQHLLNPPASNKREHGKGRAHQAQTLGSSSSSHGAVWRDGDRVIHLLNDPERDVYNGDLGYIESVNPADGSLTVRYPPRGSSAAGWCHVVTYKREDSHEQLQLAWAITVHKAQGGEFPIVLMPLEMSAGSLLLQRSLLYTAVSRAKQLLVLVGTQQALQRCLRNTAGASSSEGSGWWAEMQENRLVRKLKAAAAAKGLKPFPRMVFGADGLHAERQ